MLRRAFVLWLFAAACAPSPADRDGGSDAGAVVDRDAGTIAVDAGFPAGPCGTNAYWTRGEEGSALMNPGQDCVFCHRNEPSAPRFLTAGTVMAGLHDVDDCDGVQGAVVRITGADGGVVEVTTNAAGNFYVPADAGILIAVPYTATVFYEGRERPMAGAQTMLDCMVCHSARGGAGAPGRIEAP